MLKNYFKKTVVFTALLCGAAAAFPFCDYDVKDSEWLTVKPSVNYELSPGNYYYFTPSFDNWRLGDYTGLFFNMMKKTTDDVKIKTADVAAVYFKKGVRPGDASKRQSLLMCVKCFNCSKDKYFVNFTIDNDMCYQGSVTLPDGKVHYSQKYCMPLTK